MYQPSCIFPVPPVPIQQAQAFGIWYRPQLIAYETIEETIEFDPSIASAYGKTVQETLLLNSTIDSNSTQNAIVSEQFVFSTAIRIAWELIVSDTITFDTTVEQFRGAVILIRDICQFHDVAVSAATVHSVVSEIMDLVATQGYSFEAAVAEVINLVASEELNLNAYETVSEDLILQDTVTPYIAVFGIVEDAIALDDTAESQGIYQALVSDTMTFAIAFSDGEEVYSAWVMNTANAGVTEYLNYEFNSFARIGSTYFAAGPNGLYKLEGTDDDSVPIEFLIRTGKMDVGKGHQSRVEQMYMGVSTSGKVLVKTITGNGIERWYESDTPNTGLDTLRAKLGRGVKSRYWQFELTNLDGETIEELEDIQFYPVILSRRVR